ncbi:MAG: cytochrome c [Gemmatimonadetes bacterium]|jgi:mono/diheme cytochrome c family protein|nr:cytochrome c [Gemmatimonadota bacterium]
MRSVTLTRILVAAATLTVATGCKPLDDAMVAIFGRSMRDQPSLKPYEDPRPEPPHSIAFSAGNFPKDRYSVNLGEDDGMRPDMPFLTPADMVPPGTEVVRSIRNPVPSDSLSLTRGKVLYDRVCVVCHGPQGIGAGAYIASKHPTVAAYNLAGPQVQGYTDGYIFSMIFMGRGLMPSYQHEFTYYDRWNIVNYVRELERQYNTANGRANAAIPGLVESQKLGQSGGDTAGGK